MARRGTRRVSTYRGQTSSPGLIQKKRYFSRLTMPTAWWNEPLRPVIRSTRNPLPTYRRVVNRSRMTPLRVKNIISHPLNYAFKQTEAYRALVCAKRKIRKEVLHALHLTNRGAGTPHHRSGDSDIRC